MSVDDGPWDGNAAMSRAAQSDDPAAAYRAICAGRRDGDPALQSTWALPHHAEPGEGCNADGVRNAISRLPQTQGLINHDAAQAHLEAHMAEIHDAMESPDGGELAVPAMHRTLQVDESLQTLSVSQRKLGLRLLTYNTVVDSRYGPLMFEPGAFGDVNPADVRLRMDHEDPPTGIGVTFKDTATAPVMDFRVSRTQRGDDQLTLASDGTSRGVSVGYDDIPGKPRVRSIEGKRVLVYPANSARLAEVSTTWQPTFPEPAAGVMYVLSKDEKGTAQMGENMESPSVGEAPIVDTTPIVEAITKGFAEGKSFARMEDAVDKMLGVVDQFKELQRAQFTVPATSEPKKALLSSWVEVTLRRMAGQQVSPTELKSLALDDIITTEQPGLVPTQFTPDYDDLINNDRPFLNSTRKILPPQTGNSMVLPIITTRAVAGTQAGGEKTEVTTTGTRVGTGTFAYKTVLGGADVSIQMINRAERSFFDLLTGDIAMAYALDCDLKAIQALLLGYTASPSGAHVPVSGGFLDPENLLIGAAWQNSITVYKRAPDTIWMNAKAVAAFIDAKAPLTNAPLYSNLAASFTTGGGPGGALSGLRPVYVPALDSEPSGVDVIIGPSRGFVWAEDPARNLQADQPSLAGRDIALVGGIFPAPRYADAFTVYGIAGS